MSNKHKEIIAIIAARNKTIIDEEDPILIINTLFEHAVEQLENVSQSQQHQLNQHTEAMLARFDHTMTNNLAHWSDSIDKKAEHLIKIGLEENRDQIAEAKKAFFVELSSQITNQQIITNAAAEKIQNAALINLVTVSLAIVVGVVATIITFS